MPALRILTEDADASIRAEAAQRMPADALPALANDADWRVRYEVARRAAPAYLAPLAKDEDPMVKEIARERLWPLGAGAGPIDISNVISREH